MTSLFDVSAATCRYWNVLIVIWYVTVVPVCGLGLPSIYWNSSNPMFKTSNNDHIVEVNLGDSIDFVCPHYSTGTDIRHMEYYTIYQVSRWEYDHCTFSPDTSATFIVNCTDPNQRKRFTIWFDDFAAIPNVPEFSRGGTYYFITTSTGERDGMSNVYQGACYYRNMRLKVQVCCKSPSESQSEASMQEDDSLKIDRELISNTGKSTSHHHHHPSPAPPKTITKDEMPVNDSPRLHVPSMPQSGVNNDQPAPAQRPRQQVKTGRTINTDMEERAGRKLSRQQQQHQQHQHPVSETDDHFNRKGPRQQTKGNRFSDNTIGEHNHGKSYTHKKENITQPTFTDISQTDYNKDIQSQQNYESLPGLNYEGLPPESEEILIQQEYYRTSGTRQQLTLHYVLHIVCLAAYSWLYASYVT